MPSSEFPWVKNLADETLQICVNLDLYPPEALFRVCYSFTDRCYLFLDHEEAPAIVKVHFAKRATGCDPAIIAGEFSNELINQKVRLDIAAETRPIRELIVAQAFAEADLLDRSDMEADYRDDPRGISR
jgi:His-Xaa-Ser system protein HxsD